MNFDIIEINTENYAISEIEGDCLFEIGANIKSIRQHKNISQRKLAERAGISNTYLSDIEVGRTNPSLKTLEKIAAALEMEIKELF
ncbi:helix-turn-helix domain-containing protein [Clostridiaceae bacterium HFYG-1003]|nr:helix-turn-helix domain-containing protein [Clostridiaceae bacterium HFYG-1003]